MTQDPKNFDGIASEVEAVESVVQIDPVGLSEQANSERVRRALEHSGQNFKTQFLKKFDDFSGANFDETIKKYQGPTTERKIEIEKRLNDLGELMEGAEFGWWLDGAINISLLQGDGSFIRDHKDVDMSISVENLPALEKQLATRGYTIIFSDRTRYTETQRCVEVVSAVEIAERALSELQIARINPNGMINNEHDKLNFIDLHIIVSNEDGTKTIPYSGTTFPAEYFAHGRIYTTTSGRLVNLSHPALVAYHKIETGRNYDLTDITLLKEHLTAADILMLDGVFKNEPERILQRYAPTIKKGFEDLKTTMSDEEIRTTLAKTGVVRDPDAARFVDEFPKFYREHSEMNAEEFFQKLLKSAKIVDKLHMRAQEKIEKLYRALGI